MKGTGAAAAASSDDPSDPRGEETETETSSNNHTLRRGDSYASSLFDTAEEDGSSHFALPSPPYRPQASSSNIPLDFLHPPPATPAYTSRSQLSLSYMSAREEADRSREGSDLERDATSSAEPDPSEFKHNNSKKPTVHYQDVALHDGTDHPGPAPSYHTRNATNEDFRPEPLSRTTTAATEDEDDSSDDMYDWSGEEDLVDQEAKFEHKMGVKSKNKRWGPKRIALVLFSTLLGSLLLASILVAIALLVHFLWYKPHPTSHRHYIKNNVEAWLFWAAANLLVSWFLGFIIDLVPGVARLLVSIAWGHVSESFKAKAEMYDSVKDTGKPVFFAASGWVSWVIIFQGIYQLRNPDGESMAPYTDRLYQVIEFVFFFSLVMCGERMLSHMVAFAFHRVAYQDRIESLEKALDAIEHLRRYKPKRRKREGGGGGGGIRSGKHSPFFPFTPFTPFATGEKEREHYFEKGRGADTPERDGGGEADTEGEEKIRMKALKKGKARRDNEAEEEEEKRRREGRRLLRRRSDGTEYEPNEPYTPSPAHRYPPSTPQRGAGEEDNGNENEAEAVVVQAAKALKSAVLHDARNIKGKDAPMGGLVLGVDSAREAKKLARSIYYALKARGRDDLLPSDFEPAFDSPEAAQAAFRVFDNDNNGDISRAEIKTALLKAYKERRLLSRSLRDVGIALKTLDQILVFFALVILFFIALSVFDVDVENSLTSLYSILIAASFIFKNAASSAFDAVMFLFVSHPFDTGDRCFIDDENLVVKKMGLFATVFTRVDGSETYYFNSLLFTKFITNVRRSGKQFENLVMQVAWKTPLEKLDALEKCMNEWLQTEPNRWFEPSTGVTLSKIENQKYLEVTMGIGHKGNWQDWGMRNQRKTTFHVAVNYYCRQLGITFYESPMPIVWADRDNLTYSPSSPYEEMGMPSPIPPSPNPLPSGTSDQEGEPVVDVANVKPALGFVPTRSSVKPRKSKGKKAALRSMGADG